MALTKVTKELIQGGLGIDWQATIKTGNFQAVASQGYFVNTTSNQVIVTMPPTASVGDIVSIVDYAGTAQTNNITITAQSNINGSANDVKIDYQRGAVSIIYSGTIQGWVAEFAANDGTDALVNVVSGFAANYLVVAGGGGSNSGGGGAGGYLTNYGGTALTLASSINYSVTVGAGGVGATHANKTSVTSGSNSIFSIFETTGGGRSGLTDGGTQDGATGGSGGGGAGDGVGSTGGSGNTPSTTPSQGNNGGSAPSSAPYPGGGGGGAGGAGGAGSGQTGGAGGLGLANSITGTSTFYAGGGGGGAAFSNSQGYPGQTGGVGGSGVGGNGGSNASGGDGTANTGSGGGGFGDYAAAQNYIGGDGGSGIVILRYPTADVSSYAVTGTLDTVANTAYPIANKAYYKLNGNANDSSGNGYNGTASNVTYAAGRFGQTGVFNGSNSKIEISGLNSFMASSSSKSWSCWVKTTSTGNIGNRAIISDYGSGQGNYNFDCFLTPVNGKVLLYSKAGGSTVGITSLVTINDGVWHHICAVQDTATTNLKLYIDSNLQGSMTIGTGTRLSSLFIGTYGAGYYWDGEIDQVRIFSSALSAGNVTSLYNESTVVESTDGTDSILQFIGGTGDITFS
jgi:hypothetical protein